tara:strand:+ start:992 stop:1204 length:213 start_codon:yes stop_codon:yes gene_type:complete
MPLKKVKQFIDDPTVSLKIDGVVTEMYPKLDKDEVKEVSHFVFHRINMSHVHEQARELIKEYVDDELGKF